MKESLYKVAAYKASCTCYKYSFSLKVYIIFQHKN